ncbi:hypothetical protein N7493_000461 [Penicillium malachiteum]|uniref:Zn(2)-C6 fungal-type domain-containing protein n=1 Tax=Penicillium malachiteum TaxID=1324776 RepID=A0AAD6N0W6_9EURO|nr:hypothetical protein N7493_000461 [Penicillium malachiteum]
MLGRVAIPRLPDRSPLKKPSRVARACNECRSRKAKCDGRRPKCGQCVKTSLSCVYSKPKRDREKVELEWMKQKVDIYEKLLLEISQQVDSPVGHKISQVLDWQPSSGNPVVMQDGRSSFELSSPSVRSLDAFDVLDEDLNQSKDSRATGYLGKTSEVFWMRSLENEVHDSEVRNEKLPASASTASMNYRMESSEYPGLETDNIYALPAKEPAEQMLRLFMDSVQPSLPVIRQDLFIDQFNSFYSGERKHPGRKWLAILNVIFAIIMRLFQLSGQEVRYKDHQFFSRAQTLNISESLVEDHEDLQQVQLETLAAFYLLTSSHINRAWKMIGTAARSGISLGLHLEVAHNKLDAQAIEARHKLWLSIFILESRLSVMTGRASVLGISVFSVPPPLVSGETDYFATSASKESEDRPTDQLRMTWTIDRDREKVQAQQKSMRTTEATKELYFFCLSDLIVMSHDAFTRVYGIDFVQQGWEELQSCLEHYDRILVNWRSGLPDSLSFEEINWGPNLSTQDAYRVSLAMHYYSSRMLLTRPSITRKKGTEDDIKSHVLRARKDSESACLSSALALISVFPDQPSNLWLRYVPWWNVLHFLVQATTILLINISMAYSSQAKRSQSTSSNSTPNQSHHSPEVANPESVFTAIRKALRWQSHLGQTDPSARRAFDLCSNCMRRIDPGFFDLGNFASTEDGDTPELVYKGVPTDQAHQQSRSKLDVPHSQFAGTGDFGYDRNLNSGENGSGLELSGGNLGVDVDMSDYLPEDQASLDDVLDILE